VHQSTAKCPFLGWDPLEPIDDPSEVLHIDRRKGRHDETIDTREGDERDEHPEGGKLDATTVFVDTGIYSMVRQPMTLGMAIWSIALIFVFQSLLSLVLGLACVLCFWLSATKESVHNISKFGDAYKEYMHKVPMWNVLSGVLKQQRVGKG